MTVEIKGVATKAVVYYRDTKKTGTICYIRPEKVGSREIKNNLNDDNAVVVDTETFKFNNTVDLDAVVENGDAIEDVIIAYVRTCFTEPIDCFA